jgi:hypothetical protein
MWNTLKGIWRAIDTLAWIFWIVTTLLIFYYCYKHVDFRSRFLLRQPIPAVNENALEPPEQVKPGDEQPGSE